MKRFWPFLREHRLWIAFLILMLLVIDAGEVLQPYLIKTGIDQAVLTGDSEGLAAIVLLLVSLMLATFGLSALFHVSVLSLGQRLLMEIRSRMYAHLLKMPASYFDTTPGGKIITYLTGDVEAVRQFLSEGLVSVVGDLLKVAVILSAMLMINWRLALMVFLSIPLFLGVTALFRRSIRSGYRGVRKANAQLNTQIEETLSGITEIHQFDCIGSSRRQFTRMNRTYLKSYLKVVVAYALYFPMIEIVSTLALIITLLAGHQGMGRTVRVGELFAFFTYIHMFFRPLRQLAENFNTFQSAMAAAERIFNFLDEAPVEDGGLEVRTDGQYLIETKGLSFSYKPGEPVLREITLNIPKGETVAFVGVTGSGKTTLVKLLARLYDVNRGQIRLAGQEIMDLDIRSLRKIMTFVTQDPVLFPGSIAENIAMFSTAYRAKDIESAARLVGLLPLLERKELGLNSLIDNSGDGFSLGEKQLIAYARALLRNPELLILDEATSRIDSNTEKLIEEATRKVIRGRTTIMIAHRLSTIRMADRVFLFHQGRLEEEGSHEELISRGGKYARLYRLQQEMLD